MSQTRVAVIGNGPAAMRRAILAMGVTTTQAVEAWRKFDEVLRNELPTLVLPPDVEASPGFHSKDRRPYYRRYERHPPSIVVDS